MDGKTYIELKQYSTVAQLYWQHIVSVLFSFLSSKTEKHDLAQQTLPNIDATHMLPRS